MSERYNNSVTCVRSWNLSHPVTTQISKPLVSSVRPGLLLENAVGPSAWPESTSSTKEDKSNNKGKHRFRKAGKPAKVSSKSTSQTEEQVRCYNCGELNHFHAYCTQARTRFCYKCVTKSVITANCTNCEPKNYVGTLLWLVVTTHPL